MSRTSRGLFAAALGIWIWACPPAGAAEPEAEKAMDRARAEMLGRRYGPAVEALKEYIRSPQAKKDEGLLLMARALALSGDAEGAGKVLDRLAEEFPKSPLAAKALFLKADLLAAKKRTEEALKIYEEQARRVTSEARRLETAGVYLKFADSFFKPEDEVKQPDWAKADLFYAKAMEMGLPVDREAEVLLRRAEALSKMRRFPQAVALLEGWRREHKGHAKDAELALALGEAMLSTGRRPEARLVFRDLLAQAVPEEIAVKAAFGVARSFGLPEPGSAVDLELGAKALLDVVARFPANKAAPEAAYLVGASYVNAERFDEARKHLEKFLASPLARPDAEQVPLAKQLLGTCHFRAKAYGDAIEVWRRFLADHPAHGLWTEVQRQVIDAEFAIGADRYADKAFDEARKAWDAFLARNPLDSRCAAILLLYGKGDLEAKKFEPAVAQFEKLVSKYPRTDEASEALFLIGKTLEEELKKFPAALAAYRKLDFGPFVGAARERIAALERKTLRVRTERIVLADQKAVVKVAARNLEELELRAWSVDLESYFRKMHTAAGIQDLDVPLIEPDRSWKVKVEGYEPYREIEREIEVPVAGAGVWAVNVTAGDLEATTVVVRSDLALVLKASRQNFLVFAQNMKTGKPWPGVKVVLSDGKKVLLETATGADGVLLAEPEGLAAVASLRVLGAAAGSWASNTLQISNLPAGQGLSPRAFVFTDRPAYRPGDLVHLKAIVREVEKGEFSFAAGKAYAARVHDSRGALVVSGAASLTAFGTLDWTFGLPANAPLGKYRVALAPEKGTAFAAEFSVVEYRLPKLDVQVKVENPVCFRGEAVKGAIRVATFYGEPAPGREVAYGLGDQPRRTGTTNDRGEIAFEFDTREFGETQTVRLWAQVPAEGAAGAANVHVSTTGFRIDVKTLRPIYLAGEKFDVDIRTVDPAGKPCSVPLDLAIVRVEEDKGRLSEVPVESRKVTTDAKDGAARASVSFAKGGRHRVRAKGPDRFGNTVTAEAEVFVSGAEDEVKVRLLSEREEYRLGETASVDVVNRLGPKTGLLTFQGERIFRYKIVPLAAGANPVPVEMDKTLSPNFLLSAVVLDAEKIHEAKREFRVTRRLSVSVRALEETGAPGGTARIEVTTLDPMGQPVAAEVALAMVDRAYLAVFPRETPDPAATFFSRREDGCGSAASNTFT
ncbi:MAG: MG2 domain-containing protein, partial [Planctomycetes bacterium]|nr:MG2 domain-containing protein [Planctomycetota bacterium]